MNTSDIAFLGNDGVISTVEEQMDDSGFDPASIRLLFSVKDNLKGGLDALIAYLYYWEGKTQSEIARIIGVSASFVFNRLQDFREAVRGSRECRELWEEMVGGNGDGEVTG